MQPNRRNPLATLASAALTVLASIAGCGQATTFTPPPPPEVTVSPPEQRSVTSYLEYTGTTKAYESVDLRARVKGFLEKVEFQEGADVKKGQLLLVIDEEPFEIKVAVSQAKVEEAEAALRKAEQSKARQVAESQLALDEASLALSHVEERRNRALLSRNAGSREEVDKAEAATKKGEAQVEADKAYLEQTRADYDTNILAAKAAVDSAKSELRDAQINLGYCRVFAPIDGRITRKAVDVGNLVGDTDASLLATIVRDDPIYAYMSISEADLLMFRDLVRRGERVDYRKETVRLDLGMSNETGFPHEGKVDYTDPAVDPGSGTIQARGIFPNEKHTIFPGLFVRVRVPLGQKEGALLVPERALGADQAGRYLLVVDAKGKVEKRTVVVGVAEGSMRVIDRGLKADDLVVVEGIQRARPGQLVSPRKAEPAALPKLASTAAPAPARPSPAAPEAPAK